MVISTRFSRARYFLRPKYDKARDTQGTRLSQVKRCMSQRQRSNDQVVTRANDRAMDEAFSRREQHHIARFADNRRE